MRISSARTASRYACSPGVSNQHQCLSYTSIYGDREGEHTHCDTHAHAPHSRLCLGHALAWHSLPKARTRARGKASPRARRARQRGRWTERVRVTGMFAQKAARVAVTSMRVDVCCSRNKQLLPCEQYRSRRHDGSARKLEARLHLYCTHCTLPMPFHVERVTRNRPHRAEPERARPGEEEGWSSGKG